MFRSPLAACTIIALAIFGCVTAAAQDDRPLNVVFILTDNQGAWSLGCYGNPDIKTPHIDRLAKEGIRFTQAFASNPVCSPTRATYLTGLIPSQHGVHSYLGGERPNAQTGPDAYCTIREFSSLPKILKAAGYECGLSGKWHLGANLTPQEGFTDWITMPAGHTTEFYDVPVIENGEIRQEPNYLTDLWTEHGVKFIEKNKDKPFFLYLAYNGPYSLGALLNRRARNRHADYYDQQPMDSFSRDEMHPWQFANKQFLNNPVSIRRLASETSGVDDGVGRILDALDRLKLNERTLVIYAADQGLMAGQNGLWGMGDHTRPAGAFDLMMQVPLVFRHTGKIPGGTTSDLLVSNYDFLPSVLKYLGLADKWQPRPASPGRDYSPALLGKVTPWDPVVFYEMERTRAIRTDKWKYVERHPAGPHEIYDLAADHRERFNLYGQPLQADQQRALASQMTAFFAKHVEPKYDIWNGGASKAGRLNR